MVLPELFEKRMKQLLQEDFENYKKSLEENRTYGLRINPLKITVKEWIEKGVFSLEPVPWCEGGFYYNNTERPSKHPYYYAGLYYLQEPSAMAPGAYLPVSPGDTVLDICAAPGGKSTQIGAKLEGKGILVSNDISPTRAKALTKNIALFGIRNSVVVSESPKRLAEKFEGFFNKIMIDAPCSGEGMFRKEADVAKSWGEKMTEFCITQQREILFYAAKMCQSGGMILYSTCTFAPEENEGAIQEFLQEHEDFELLEIPKEYGFDAGRPEWIENGGASLQYCARLFPHRLKGEGHFLALLHKKGEKKPSQIPEIQGLQEEKLLDWINFKENNLTKPLEGKLYQLGEDLYLLPKGLPNLKGIRVMKSGWFLGKLKKKRFEPSQAFAMGLTKEDVKRTISFSSKKMEVIRYLKGESFDVDAKEDGYHLVLVDGFSLGWAKVQNGRMKNKYFPSWKME